MQRIIALGTPRRKYREYAPTSYALRNKKLLPLVQSLHDSGRSTCYDIVGKSFNLTDVSHSLTSTLEAIGVLAYVVVYILKAIEAHRHRAQARINKRLQTLTREAHAISHHAPHIASLRHLASRLLEVFAHKHLTTREDDKHLSRVNIGRHLLVQHLQEVGKGHISLRGIYTAVTTAVTALQITTKRTLPKECTQLVTLHNTIIQPLE